jgi:hypothetical protein
MKDYERIIDRFSRIAGQSAADLAQLHDFTIETRDGYE